MISNRRTIQTDQFEAVDSDGNRHTIIELTEQIDSTTLGDTGSTFMDTIKEYRLQNGGYLNRVGEDEFLIVETGETLTKI